MDDRKHSMATLFSGKASEGTAATWGGPDKTEDGQRPHFRRACTAMKCWWCGRREYAAPTISSLTLPYTYYTWPKLRMMKNQLNRKYISFCSSELVNCI